MGRRRRGLAVNGILLLDKPAGWSSNRALQKVKRIFFARKAGHTGNLDPFATGMLPVCLGEATKTAAFMLVADKRYRATLRLGVATATGDVEGEVVTEQDVPRLTVEAIKAGMSGFIGEIVQLPPMYSALKRGGRPLYELAREGREVERQPRRITIHSLKLERWQSPLLIFEVHCSKGTYVRTLAEDLAKALGSCGHLESLRRLAVEPFDPDAMVTMDEVTRAGEEGRHMDLLLPVDAGLPDWPVVEISGDDAVRFRHGNPVAVETGESAMARIYEKGGGILGLGLLEADGSLHPKRLFLMN